MLQRPLYCQPAKWLQEKVPWIITYFPCCDTNQAFFWIRTLETNLNSIHAKFMQIHACNLSTGLTSVPYCRGEGWRAKWGWDNQLSFIIYTFLHFSFSNFTIRLKHLVTCAIRYAWQWMVRPEGGLSVPLAMWSSFLTYPNEVTNTQQRRKQMNGHNPKGVRSEAPGPKN